MPSRYTDRKFAEELPRILRERGMSLRALATHREVGVDPTFLSRAIRGQRGKRPSADLARRVEMALDLPRGYFREVRLDEVALRLSEDPALLNHVYGLIQKRDPRPSS